MVGAESSSDCANKAMCGVRTGVPNDGALSISETGVYRLRVINGELNAGGSGVYDTVNVVRLTTPKVGSTSVLAGTMPSDCEVMKLPAMIEAVGALQLGIIGVQYGLKVATAMNRVGVLQNGVRGYHEALKVVPVNAPALKLGNTSTNAGPAAKPFACIEY